MRKYWKHFVFCIPLVAAFWCYYVMESYPVSKGKLDDIEIGMSKAVVQKMLGRPSDISEYSEGEVWRYSQDWKWIVVDIQFDSAGIVEGIEVDR